ncbi:CBS domain-containing protein [Nitrosopumilus sp. K4]|uniref:CBS domain-containing protein n=1 Tax=Nitrosopumilus sp. K4 TaxID=2795383 RepID=UPI001BAA846E|nr:CBS domain-containing protein [Nitrosopumilus sp. K4]QUC64233.1 CBS domain-containing protein [Nitrosopumilus sp. K4]
MTITNKSLQELLPLSFTNTPAVSIRKENKIWIATGMLIHYLESFTDSLVVTEENEKPIGVIGGREIIENVIKNPTSDFFDNTTVEQITDPNLIILSGTATLGELLDKWKQTRRAFSIIPNSLGGYSAISGRKLLEIGINCVTDLTVSELPKKDIVYFKQNSTLKEIMALMLEKNTRKLILEGTHSFISDRLIIQCIAQEFDFFRNVKFLERRIEELFKLEEAKKISKDVNLSEISKIMYTSPHPYVIYQEQVITPWDVCMALQSERIEFLG